MKYYRVLGVSRTDAWYDDSHFNNTLKGKIIGEWQLDDFSNIGKPQAYSCWIGNMYFIDLRLKELTESQIKRLR